MSYSKDFDDAMDEESFRVLEAMIGRGYVKQPTGDDQLEHWAEEWNWDDISFFDDEDHIVAGRYQLVDKKYVAECGFESLLDRISPMFVERGVAMDLDERWDMLGYDHEVTLNGETAVFDRPRVDGQRWPYWTETPHHSGRGTSKFPTECLVTVDLLNRVFGDQPDKWRWHIVGLGGEPLALVFGPDEDLAFLQYTDNAADTDAIAALVAALPK